MSMMEDVQSAVKNNTAIFGYKESIKFLKTATSKLVVVANNLPEERKNEIEHNVKMGQAKLETFDGTSRQLGTFCGVPFSVSVLVVKG